MIAKMKALLSGKSSRMPGNTDAPIYDQDGLRSAHNHEFIDDATFKSAYARGLQAAGQDFNWHWRAHKLLWAARSASTLEGDYVECGVGKGFMSSAVMQMLDWNKTGRTFYLLDTFSGVDLKYVTKVELEEGIAEKSKWLTEHGYYATSLDAVKDNFSEWRNVEFVVGSIPETLDRVKSAKICFMHLDMNCAPPEVAALETLWRKLVPGAFVVFDDYAYCGYRQQKLAIDEAAKRLNVGVLSLPTGQGLIVKPGVH